MFNVLLVLNLALGYEANELPVVKLAESNSSTVIFTEVKTPRRLLLPRRSTYVQVETIELPVVKENNEIVEITKRKPVRNTAIAIKDIVTEVNILPRRGTYIKGNDGNPIVTEKITSTTTVTKVEEKIPIDEKKDESEVIIYEDRRIFSGRGRTRIFFKSR